MSDKTIELIDLELERLHYLLTQVTNDSERERIFRLIENIMNALVLPVIHTETTGSYGTRL